MSEIHKIEKNGVTIYPATTTDAVVDAESRVALSKLIKEELVNVTALRKIDVVVNGDYYNRVYSITQGKALNTTTDINRVKVSIPANTIVEAIVNYPNGNPQDTYTIFFYEGSTYETEQIQNNTKTYFSFTSNKTGGVGINISADKSIASGDVSVIIKLSKGLVDDFNDLNEDLDLVKDNKADEKKESTNLFNPNGNNLINKNINGQGNIVDITNYYVTEAYPIEPNESISINRLLSGTNIALFSSLDDTSYAGIIQTGTGAPATIKNTSHELLYCRATVYKSYLNTTIINRGKKSLPFEEFKDGTVLRKYDVVEEDGENTDKVVSQRFVSGIKRNVDGMLSVVEKIDNDLYSEILQSQAYEVSQGKTLNTSTKSIRYYPDRTIKANTSFDVLFDYPQGNQGTEFILYFYETVDGSYITAQAKNGEWTRLVFDKDYSGGIGFYIPQNEAISNGTAQLSLSFKGKLDSVEEEVENLDYRVSELESPNRITFVDVLYHWLNGEKFPIGFHGDSTTDGVSTTGWTTENSHPAQDEATGGPGARGVVDYVCELAYPKQLQNLLRAELGNDNLKIYNIGYYGASLINNYSQLDAIYHDVYADVKMVGIMLSINDRGTYTTPADYFNGVKDYLVRYVEFFFSKGITPFMVTQQIVTQCGNNPNTGGGIYDVMYQDYIQILSNKAKEAVAKMYNLEIIDVNSFGRLLFMSSSYQYRDLTESLHFKDLGHKLEAEFLFSELIPWVNKTGNSNEMFLGINCGKSKTGFNIGRYATTATSDKFKVEINYSKEDAVNTLIFDAYVFINSKDGGYDVKYLTPLATGYIVIDGKADSPIPISNATQKDTYYELAIGKWDIGLHHVQVYTGESSTVAFRGFLLTR